MMISWFDGAYLALSRWPQTMSCENCRWWLAVNECLQCRIDQRRVSVRMRLLDDVMGQAKRPRELVDGCVRAVHRKAARECEGWRGLYCMVVRIHHEHDVAHAW